MPVTIRRDCAVITGDDVTGYSKPWIVEVDKCGGVEFMTLYGNDRGFRRWVGDQHATNQRKCQVLKLLNVYLRAAEEKLVKEAIVLSDPMCEPDVLAALDGQVLRKTYRQAFIDLPDVIEIRWPAWTFTDTLGQYKSRDAFSLRVKSKKMWHPNAQKLQIELTYENVTFISEAAQAADVWQADDDSDADETADAVADTSAADVRVDDALPSLPENFSWRIQKRQKPCICMTFTSAKKAKDQRFCTPKRVGVQSLDSIAIEVAIQTLIDIKAREGVAS
jgi:hypothetical protein